MASSATPLITVLGSINMDVVSYVPHHPAPGETLTTNKFAVSPGGKGANQAVACAKLSRPRPSSTSSTSSSPAATARVAMVGAVGPDAYGETLRRALADLGVDVEGVATDSSPGAQTGVSVIVVDEPTGQNRIMHSPEANHSLQPDMFPPTTSTSTSTGSSSSSSSSSSSGFPPFPSRPDLLVMQLEIPVPTVLAALAAARAAGVPCLLNPAPAVALPADALAGLAHLVVNETEASILGGVPEASLDDEGGLEAAAAVFADRGVRHVVITLGGRGVYYHAAGTGARGLVPAEKVAKVVDTTAAGDTFVGRYALEVVAAGSSSGPFDIENAVRKANAAAAKTVERLGAQEAIPWLDEL